MKSFEDYSYKELVDQLTWEAMQSLISGQPLRSIVWDVLQGYQSWKLLQDKKDSKK